LPTEELSISVLSQFVKFSKESLDAACMLKPIFEAISPLGDLDRARGWCQTKANWSQIAGVSPV